MKKPEKSALYKEPYKVLRNKLTMAAAEQYAHERFTKNEKRLRFLKKIFEEENE